MKKKSKSTFFLILIFIVGLSLLLYPTISDYWNSFTQSKAVSQYAEQVANLDDELYDELLNNAREYNKRLSAKGMQSTLTPNALKEYNSLLSISNNGVMGYIEIPAIDVSLPIYHGVSDAVLQVAVGHIDWSSLPVGGVGTHCVLSGHRGLPSAKLFTNLDELIVGDTFIIRVLDEVFTYEVDQIRIVLPEEVEDLKIDPKADLCTLVTCTPYGVNSHRMLVRGHRIENSEEAAVIRVTADAIKIDPILMAPLIAAPILLVLLLWVIFAPKRKLSSSIQGGKLYEIEIENNNDTDFGVGDGT